MGLNLRLSPVNHEASKLGVPTWAGHSARLGSVRAPAWAQRPGLGLCKAQVSTSGAALNSPFCFLCLEALLLALGVRATSHSDRPQTFASAPAPTPGPRVCSWGAGHPHPPQPPLQREAWLRCPWEGAGRSEPVSHLDSSPSHGEKRNPPFPF